MASNQTKRTKSHAKAGFVRWHVSRVRPLYLRFKLKMVLVCLLWKFCACYEPHSLRHMCMCLFGTQKHYQQGVSSAKYKNTRCHQPVRFNLRLIKLSLSLVLCALDFYDFKHKCLVAAHENSLNSRRASKREREWQHMCGFGASFLQMAATFLFISRDSCNNN